MRTSSVVVESASRNPQKEAIKLSRRKTYSPETLENVEMDIVLGEFLVDAEESLGRRKKSGIRHGGHCNTK